MGYTFELIVKSLLTVGIGVLVALGLGFILERGLELSSLLSWSIAISTGTFISVCYGWGVK